MRPTSLQTATLGSSISNQPFPCLNRASSSCTSSDLGRSRSTPGWGRTPRTVIGRNGGSSDFPRCFRASSSVLAIKVLTLMPRALAARCTCFANWSSSEIVVLMMHQHTVLSSVHRRRGLFQPRRELVWWRAKGRRSDTARPRAARLQDCSSMHVANQAEACCVLQPPSGIRGPMCIRPPKVCRRYTRCYCRSRPCVSKGVDRGIVRYRHPPQPRHPRLLHPLVPARQAPQGGAHRPAMRKLLLILNAVVRDQVPWHPDRMPMAGET